MPPVDEWFRLGVIQTGQIAVLIPVVVGLVRLLCRRNSHLAYALLLLVLLKCLMPPVWESRFGLFARLNDWLPGPQLAQPQNTDQPPTAPESSPHRSSHPPLADSLSEVASLDESNAEGPAQSSTERPLESQATDGPAASAVTVERAQPTRIASQRSVDGALLLSGIWALGAAGMLVWLASALVRLRRLRTGAVDAGTSLHSSSQRVAKRLGLARMPDLLVTDDVSIPLAFGLTRPTVLLPQHVVGSAKHEELELILTHEFNHIRRGDRWIGALQVLSQVVWWFHPCVWWLNREIRRYREHCCDEEVLAHIDCPPRRYAECLLSVLELQERCSPMLGLAGMSPFEVTSQRMRNIMRTSGWFRRQTPAWCWLVLIGLSLVILPGASLSEPSSLGAGPVADRDPTTATAERETRSSPGSLAGEKAGAAARRHLPLFYQWSPGTRYAYRTRIVIDHGNTLETLSGTPTFFVRSVDDGVAELVVTGDRLLSVRQPKPERISALEFPTILAPPRVDFPEPRTVGELIVHVDATGRLISSSRELDRLPCLTGRITEVVFPSLHQSNRIDWRESVTTTVHVDDPDESFDSRSFSPFAQRAPELLRAESDLDFHIESTAAEQTTLTRTTSTATITTVNGKPRIELNGESRWTFEAEQGPPVLIEQDNRLIIRHDNREVTYPVSLTAQLVPPGDPAPGESTAGKAPPSYRGPHPVPSSERAVTSETPLLLGQVLQVNWNGAWYPAEVKRLEPSGAVHVHYRGWSSRWDELVDRSRIQLADRDATDID